MADGSKERKIKRKEILERRKAINEVVKAAYAVGDHLSSFPAFLKYQRNGLSLFLESGSGSGLSIPIKQYIQSLLKVNMEKRYGNEWSTEEKVKRREMVDPEACYIFIREEENQTHPIVGVVNYRFTIEEDLPVLYVYELQLEPHVQGKGLGKFLMQLIELIALKSKMAAVMLTVQKSNEPAMKFYLCKLRYQISKISPSKVDPLSEAEASYEILCKVFNAEAKPKLEAKIK
ncbi:acyl-CoA N-acyltransferases (NAT) superfamily protein isoform X2 [Wolffia australiana]